jgi:hypothetical protein
MHTSSEKNDKPPLETNLVWFWRDSSVECILHRVPCCVPVLIVTWKKTTSRVTKFDTGCHLLISVTTVTVPGRGPPNWTCRCLRRSMVMVGSDKFRVSEILVYLPPGWNGSQYMQTDKKSHELLTPSLGSILAGRLVIVFQKWRLSWFHGYS